VERAETKGGKRKASGAKEGAYELNTKRHACIQRVSDSPSFTFQASGALTKGHWGEEEQGSARIALVSILPASPLPLAGLAPFPSGVSSFMWSSPLLHR
jgi:hypothetical protein